MEGKFKERNRNNRENDLNGDEVEDGLLKERKKETTIPKSLNLEEGQFTDRNKKGGRKFDSDEK